MLTGVAMKRMVFVVIVSSHKQDSYTRAVVYVSGRITPYAFVASDLPDLSRENLDPVIPAIVLELDCFSLPPNRVRSLNSRTFRLL